jgi:hypothetical protein
MPDDTNNSIEDSNLRELQEEGLRLENEKLRREEQKLIIEIQELSRPWWRRPNSYFAGLPTLLALATVIYGLSNGYFSTERGKLEVKRDLLQIEIAKFESRRDALLDSLGILKDRVGVMGDSVKYLNTVVNNLNGVLFSEVAIRKRLELPTVYMCAILNLDESGKETLYLRGYHFGSIKGIIPVWLSKDERLGLAPIHPDSTVRVEWSDTLIVLSANQIRSPFFEAIRYCVQSPKFAASALIQTSEKTFSNSCRLEVRK